MRRVLLTASLFALLAALLAMWACRFERSPGLPTWRMADLRDGVPPLDGVEWTGTQSHLKLRLHVDGTDHPPALRLAIPGVPAVDGLHLRFRLLSRHLIPGVEKWQDGRIMVEWHSVKGGLAPESAPAGSVRFDTQGPLEDFVVQSLTPPAVPFLRLEHLGRAGEFELSDLEITAVRERSIWTIGRWFLILGWLAWFTAFARSWPGVSRWRAIGAASIWVLMGVQSVIPGPWKIQRAMVPEFQIGTEFSGNSADSPTDVRRRPEATMPRLESGPIAALGKLPDQGSFALRVKVAAARARPLLHAVLLFAPSLAFVWLLGRRPALILAALLAVSIELAQVAFGYGFDLIDVGDLASDAVGIALACWVHGRLNQRWHLKAWHLGARQLKMKDR